MASTIDERLGMIGGDERKVKQVLLNLLSLAARPKWATYDRSYCRPAVRA